jgi:hypothetical protein
MPTNGVEAVSQTGMVYEDTRGNMFFVTSLSVSLHNLLDFYNLFSLCCIVMSRRSATHYVFWLVDSLRLYIYIYKTEKGHKDKR